MKISIKRLFACVTGIGHVRSRYSTTTYQGLLQYMQTTSRWRIAATLFGTPLPSVLIASLPCMIPLQDPSHGIAQNYTFFLSDATVMGIFITTTLIVARSVTGLSESEYTNFDLVKIILLSILFYFILVPLIAWFWCFPIPWMDTIILVPMSLFNCLIHILMFWKQPHVRTQLASFIFPFLISSTQMILYPLYSHLMIDATLLDQILFTFFFSCLKFFLKYILRRVCLPLPSHGALTSLCTIEIGATLFQAMLMQHTPSFQATILLLGIDLVHGFLSIHLFMDTTLIVGRHELFGMAQQLIVEHGSSLCDTMLNPFGTVRVLPLRRSSIQPENVNDVSKYKLKVIAHDNLIIVQALEMLYISERILLVEYIEIALPSTNLLFILLASCFSSAQYNHKLKPFYDHPSQLVPIGMNLVLYSILQSSTLFLMSWIVWSRYRFNPFYQLAYVLTRHFQLIQALLIGWTTLLVHYPIIHTHMIGK